MSTLRNVDVDPDLLEGVFRDSWDRLVALAERRGGGRHAAEDAVAEAFARGFERLPPDLSTDEAAGWIYTVARNQLVSALRTEPRKRGAAGAESGAEASPDPLSMVLAAESAELARAALKSLAPRDVELLEARYIRDLPIRSIASVRGTTRGSTKVAISRANQRLRREARRRGLLSLVPAGIRVRNASQWTAIRQWSALAVGCAAAIGTLIIVTPVGRAEPSAHRAAEAEHIVPEPRRTTSGDATATAHRRVIATHETSIRQGVTEPATSPAPERALVEVVPPKAGVSDEPPDGEPDATADLSSMTPLPLAVDIYLPSSCPVSPWPLHGECEQTRS